jgi:predicted porin
MKRTLVALAALAATGAFAQSSVTLYGTVDATVAYGSGDLATKTQLSNSGLNSSELGFKGIEDLGGGLSAGFILAAGIANDNGGGGSLSTNNQTVNNASGGLVFNRRSYLRLMSSSWGELRAGRDYTPVFWSEAIFDPIGVNGVGASRVYIGGSAYTGAVAVRASNSLGYLSPNMGGLTVWGQLYMGENLSNVANSSAGNGGAVRVSYEKGPLSVAAAYGTTNVSNGIDTNVTNVGGTYDFGAFKLNAYAQRNTITNGPDVNGYLIGGSVPVGAGLIRTSFANTDNGTAKTNQFALGYVYNLSKTTQAYVTYAVVNNDGYASAALTPGLNGGAPSMNGSSSGFDVGLAKSF